MNKLSIVLLSFAFTSVSFANTSNCENLLKNVHDQLAIFEEALEANDKVESVVEKVADNKPVSCSELNAVINTFEVSVGALSAAATDMGTAESKSCKINSETDMKAEDIFVVYFQFEIVLKTLKDAQSAGACN